MEKVIQNLGYTSKDDFEMLKLLKAPFTILRGKKQDVLYLHEKFVLGDEYLLCRVLDHEKAYYTEDMPRKKVFIGRVIANTHSHTIDQIDYSRWNNGNQILTYQNYYQDYD